MATQPRIVVRKAQEEDYEAVMDINRELALGADYLCYQYSELINDPDSTYYVCEVDGEVAAFEGVSLIDDNKTLMTRSARVKERFRGQGLLNRIRKKIYEDYKDVPGQKRIRTCCANIVRLLDSATFRSQNRFLGTRACAIYDPMEVEQWPAAYINATRTPEVRTVDPMILGILFQNKELTSYLFPMGFLVVMSWFFYPFVSNIKHIQKQRPHVSISATLERYVEKLNSSPNSETSQLESKGKEQIDGPSGLLAICGHYKAQAMLYYNIEIYGKPKQGHEDVELRSVIFHGLKLATSTTEHDQAKRPLSFGINTDSDELLRMCKSILAPLELPQVKMSAFECQNFFEQEFGKLVN